MLSMLAKLNFAADVLFLAELYPFSVTSWGRTVERNKAVGGARRSRHIDFAAVDFVLDAGASHRDALIAMARKLGCRVIPENDHIHIEATRAHERGELAAVTASAGSARSAWGGPPRRRKAGQTKQT